MPSDTAFLYDFLLVNGGAEAVALHVARCQPQIDLVAGFIDRDVFPVDQVPPELCRSLTGATRARGWQGLKVMRAFDRSGGFLADYDTVVFSGVYAPVGVSHRPGGRNRYYCHTPPRFAYDLEDHYLRQAHPWQRPLLRRLAGHLRRRYADALSRMDAIAANSGNVRDRLKKHLGITGVHVIHPPVDTRQFQWLGQDDYYLSTARLEPYKRVDRIVRAFARMPQHKLVVASGGSAETPLRRLAGGCDNIRFTGWQSPAELRRLTGHCIATVYVPEDEDFGISPVESMAAGKPVIGVDQGGLRETVVDGETGWLLPAAAIGGGPDAASEALRDAVARLSARAAAAMRPACESRAAQFDASVFDAAFSRFVRGEGARDPSAATGGPRDPSP